MPCNAFVTAPRLREKKKQAHKQSKSHKQSKNEVEAGRNSLFLPPALGGRLGSVPIPHIGCRGRSPRRGCRGSPPVSQNVGGQARWDNGLRRQKPPPSRACHGARGRAESLPSRRGPQLPLDDSQERFDRLHAPLVCITGFVRGRQGAMTAPLFLEEIQVDGECGR